MEIEYKSKAWLMMQFLNDFGPQQREQLTGDDTTALGIVKDLMKTRFMCKVDGGLVGLSLRGKTKLQNVNRDASTKDLEIVGPRTYRSTGTYEGKELGRNCVRPGAYDAYELPSLMGGKRVERRAA